MEDRASLLALKICVGMCEAKWQGLGVALELTMLGVTSVLQYKVFYNNYTFQEGLSSRKGDGGVESLDT